MSGAGGAIARAAALVLVCAGSTRAAPDFVESFVDLRGDVLRFECPDVDQDGDGDLLVVHREENDRVLSLWLLRPDGSLPAEADWRMSLPGDVVSYAVFDARPDPGLEILLLTGRGVHSVSPATRGLKGNLRREVELELFPDVADPDDVPAFRLIADLDGDGRDDLLLPSADALHAHACDRSGEAWRIVPLAQGGVVPCRVRALESTARRGFATLRGKTEIEIDSNVAGLFPGRRSSLPRFEDFRYLSRGATWRVPALVDWNGDRRLDAVQQDGADLIVRLQDGQGAFPEEDLLRVEGVLSGDEDVRFVDLDGDGVRELLTYRESGEGLSREFVAMVRPREGERFAAEPAARVKLEASNVDWRLCDVDRDGRTDLVARTLDLPSGITDLASVRIVSSLYVFLGEEGAGWSRRPLARFVRTFRPEQLERVRESQVGDLTGDFDGDGLSDLLIVQPDGVLEIRPLRRAGGELAFQEQAFSSFRPRRPIRAAVPVVMSPDPVSDLVLRHETGFTIYVSRGGGR